MFSSNSELSQNGINCWLAFQVFRSLIVGVMILKSFSNRVRVAFVN